MRAKQVFLTAGLLILAVTVGLLLPPVMANVKSNAADDIMEYEIQAVNLEYSHQISLAEKYDLMDQIETSVYLSAGHIRIEDEIEKNCQIFLKNAFPGIGTSIEPDIQPVLCVVGEEAIPCWQYHTYVELQNGMGIVHLYLVCDDVTGAVLEFALDARDAGIIFTLQGLLGLPDGYWMQENRILEARHALTEQVVFALQQGAAELDIEFMIIEDYVDSFDVAIEVAEAADSPIYFSDLLLLTEENDREVFLELCCEEHLLYFNWNRNMIF